MKDKPRILIIEDDKFLNKLYSDKLIREGFAVSVAISGDEGWNKIIGEKPDLVLLDVVLPQKNGFEILSQMKLNPETKDIPVIMLTSLGQDTDIKTGRKLGAADYLVKTDFSITKLAEVVKAHLVMSKKK